MIIIIRNSTNFILNGITNQELKIINCNINNGMQEEFFMHPIELTTTQIKGRDELYLQYKRNNTFNFNVTFAFENTFTNNDLRVLKRLLNSEYFIPLQFIDESDEQTALNYIYYIMLSDESTLTHNCLNQGYVTLNFLSKSPYSFSNFMESQLYDFSSITETTIILNDSLSSNANNIWKTQSGSFTYSVSGATSTALNSIIYSGDSVWKPLIGSNNISLPLTAQATFTTPNSLTGLTILGHLDIRIDNNNMYRCEITNSTMYLTKVISGVHTDLTSVSQTISINTTYTITLSLTSTGILTAKLYSGVDTSGTLLQTLTTTNTLLTSGFSVGVGGDIGVIIKNVIVTAPNTSPQNDIEFVNFGDVECKPEIYIEKIGGGDLSIVNISNSGVEFKFTGLLDEEELEVSNEYEIIKTSLINTYRYNSFNGNFLSFDYGVNNLKVTGTVKFYFKYQFKYL